MCKFLVAEAGVYIAGEVTLFTFKVNMHNKLTSKFALSLHKLRTSKTLCTLNGSQINPSSWNCQQIQISAIVGDCTENLSNLLRSETRKFVTCGCLQSNMNKNKTQLVNSSEVFRLNEYDCVGFDLDNTICRYKLSAMVKLEYDTLAQYLVKEKGYDSEYLYKPVEDDLNFIQKGLVLDCTRGNVLQISSNGHVLKASHGTKFLNDDEIMQTYGEDRRWEVAAEFTKNMLEAWNGPLSEKIRSLLDYFDMPTALAFARIVDSLDAMGNSKKVCNVWPDVLDGLIYMFRRENFMNNAGGYFPALKDNPEKYIYRCPEKVLNWLKQIKKEKLTFLITGSHVDFASMVASTSMGDDWRNMFDIVVYYARKPGFFTGGRPFVSIEGTNEGNPLRGSDLQIGNTYSQGNWQDLFGLFCRVTGKSRPKCVYIGDNLIQDVYTPSEYTACDTVAVVEEMIAEGMFGYGPCHADAPVLISNIWGSYFSSQVFGKDTEENANYSIWVDIIRKHSKLCVPNLEVLSSHSLDHSYPAFVIDDKNRSKQLGYYPNNPVYLKIQDDTSTVETKQS